MKHTYFLWFTTATKNDIIRACVEIKSLNTKRELITMVSKDSLMKIRQDVENYIGQEICVKANVGRNKCIERKGYIDSTYTNLFVFRDSETDSKLSYSYSDLVTNTLELSLPSGEPITRYDFSTPKYTRL